MSIVTIRSGPLPGTRSRQVPYPPGGPSRLAGVKANPAPPGGPGPARVLWLPGSGRAQPWPTAWPCWSVTVTHQVVLGLRAAAAARSRASHGSTGPSPDSSPGRSARPAAVPSGTVSVTWPANPPAAPPAGPAPGGCCAAPPSCASGVRGLGGAGAGVFAEDQVQEGAGAQLIHAALQPGFAQLAGPPADLLVGGQYLIGRQFAAHQGGVAGVLGPPFYPGRLGRGLPPLPGLARRDFHHRAGQRGAQPARGQLPGPAQDLGLHRLGLVIGEVLGEPDDQLGLSPGYDPVGQHIQGRAQPGGQVPRHGQQPVRRGPGLAQCEGQLVAGELVHHQRHLPRLRLEPVLGVTAEHLRDGHELAGGHVRLEPVPRAHQPDQLMIGRPAEPVSGAAAVHRGVGGHGQLGAARHHVPRHPGAEPGRAARRLPREDPGRAGLAGAAPSRAGRIQGEHLIGGGLADPGQLPGGQLVLAGRRRAGLRIPVLPGSVERVVIELAQPVQPRLPVRGVTGSRSGRAGSSSHPGSAGAGTEGMDHIRSEE